MVKEMLFGTQIHRGAGMEQQLRYNAEKTEGNQHTPLYDPVIVRIEEAVNADP